MVKNPEKIQKKTGTNPGKVRERSMGILGEVGKVFSRVVF